MDHYHDVYIIETDEITKLGKDWVTPNKKSNWFSDGGFAYYYDSAANGVILNCYPYEVKPFSSEDEDDFLEGIDEYFNGTNHYIDNNEFILKLLCTCGLIPSGNYFISSYW